MSWSGIPLSLTPSWSALAALGFTALGLIFLDGPRGGISPCQAILATHIGTERYHGSGVPSRDHARKIPETQEQVQVQGGVQIQTLIFYCIFPTLGFLIFA